MTNYNPYAAPGSPYTPGPQSGHGLVAGPPQPWSPGETTGVAWAHFKRCWGVLVGTYFVTGLVTAIPQQVPTVLQLTHTVARGSTEYWVIYAISNVIGLVIQLLFQTGLMRIWVSVVRGGNPGFGELFSGMSRFLPMLAVSFLNLLIILLGYAALVVPGVILGLGLSLSGFFVAEAELGPIEAMRASWRATRGHKGNIFVFGLIGAGLLLLGLCACCIGIYVTFPIFWLGFAVIYVRLSGRGWTTPGYEAAGGMGGGGGGGPGYPGQGAGAPPPYATAPYGYGGGPGYPGYPGQGGGAPPAPPGY